MLSKITAQNFMSWKELTFSITKGATLVDGWNEDDQRSEGSGKSAVLNSICWAIFGKLPKDANVDEVIKDGETSCAVVLEFDNGDAIVRSRKPNELLLSKAGATIKGKDARETQTIIEEYVGCNFETFCQSVYFAQNYDKKFLSSNQEEKGKILSSIQNLQVFDKARKEVMDLIKLEDGKISKLKTEIQVQENNLTNNKSQKSLVESFIQDKIQKHKAQVNMVTQQINMLSGHIKRTETDLENISQRVVLIDLDALAKDKQELDQAKTEFSTQLSGILYEKSQVDSVRKVLQGKAKEIMTIAEKHNSLEKKLKSAVLEKQPEYVRLEADKKKTENYQSNLSFIRLNNKKAELEKFIANPSSSCPTCGAELEAVDTTHTMLELNTINNEIQEIIDESAAKVIAITQAQAQQAEKFKDDQAKLEMELNELVDQHQVLTQYLVDNPQPSLEDLTAKELEAKQVIAQIDDALFQTQQKTLEHAQLTNQWKSLSDQVANYNQQKSAYETQLEQLGQPDIKEDELKLANINSQLEVIGEKISELKRLLDESNSHSLRLETLKDGFKEIKSFVFTNALNELNFRTNQYLNELFEMEASIKFTNDDQKIESKITVNGQSRSLGLLSGGQNRRFNLAVDLALSDIVSYRKSSKLDLLIFDEYFKDLSEISMEKSLDLLKARKCPVILIEHNSIFKNIVDNTFFVRLQNGTSYESRA
jgi:exonuclease SbcC